MTFQPAGAPDSSFARTAASFLFLGEQDHDLAVPDAVPTGGGELRGYGGAALRLGLCIGLRAFGRIGEFEALRLHGERNGPTGKKNGR